VKWADSEIDLKSVSEVLKQIPPAPDRARSQCPMYNADVIPDATVQGSGPLRTMTKISVAHSQGITGGGT
jgi:hypothetical protein